MPHYAHFEIYVDNASEHRWRLRAANGHIIAVSGEGYKHRTSCLDAILLVRSIALDSPVLA